MKHVTLLQVTKVFLLSATVILALTSFAKAATALGRAPLLDVTDGVVLVSYRALLHLAAILEMGVLAFIVFAKTSKAKLIAVLWLAGIFGIYRLSAVFLNPPGFCPCLGNITDVLHISKETASIAMTTLFAYLLFGSAGLIFAEYVSRARSRADV